MGRTIWTRVVGFYNKETSFTREETAVGRTAEKLPQSAECDMTLAVPTDQSHVSSLHLLVSDQCARCVKRGVMTKQDGTEPLIWCHPEHLTVETKQKVPMCNKRHTLWFYICIRHKQIHDWLFLVYNCVLNVSRTRTSPHPFDFKEITTFQAEKGKKKKQKKKLQMIHAVSIPHQVFAVVNWLQRSLSLAKSYRTELTLEHH